MARFKLARQGQIEFPSFSNELIPVLNKLVSSCDRAALAEWCTNQCNKYDDYKLNCLSEFLNATIAASTEIEHRRRHFPNDKILKQQERNFLERIRSITSSKSTLSDFLNATKVLRSHASNVPKILGQLIDSLIVALEQTIKEIPTTTPEELVDFLFSSGSRLASDTCLRGESSFPINYFRRYCSIVHSVCCDIANQYSHIDVTDRARRLAYRWLFFGDEGISIECGRACVQVDQNVLRGYDNIDEESIMDFVMDLSAVHRLKSEDYNHMANGHTKEEEESRTNSLEERSSLHVCTLRELSDVASRRSGLRIAFVLAFTVPKQISETDRLDQKENSDSNREAIPENSTSKRPGLLANRFSRDNKHVFDLGSELLRIVFAKSRSISNTLQRFQPKSLVSITDDTTTDVPSTITFAMRHRALRVASILCPQEVLEEIVRTNGMLVPSNNLEQLSLRQCSYGTFIAKEIEEIGLPLPHSELLQLSSMHFLSYARSLWRDHRDDAILDKSKGRFYLLLIELCLHNDHTDPHFVSQLLEEMARQNQSRSLLQALEQFVEYDGRAVDSKLSFAFDSAKKATISVANVIFSDLERGIAHWQEMLNPHHADINNTLERLNMVILTLLDAEEAMAHFDKFIDLLHPVANDLTLEVLLITTKRDREKAERYYGSI